MAAVSTGIELFMSALIQSLVKVNEFNKFQIVEVRYIDFKYLVKTTWHHFRSNLVVASS